MLGINIAILLPTVLTQVHQKTEFEAIVWCYSNTSQGKTMRDKGNIAEKAVLSNWLPKLNDGSIWLYLLERMLYVNISGRLTGVGCEWGKRKKIPSLICQRLPHKALSFSTHLDCSCVRTQ